LFVAANSRPLGPRKAPRAQPGKAKQKQAALRLVRLDGTSVPVDAAFEYLVTASWEGQHDPLVVVQSRDQRNIRLLAVDAGSGQARVLRADPDS